MREISEDEIAAYIATGEPMDKAGATPSRAMPRAGFLVLKVVISMSSDCHWLEWRKCWSLLASSSKARTS